MPSVAMRVLKTALESGSFDRVYLFHGDDEFLKEEKVRAVVERATDAATRDFNLEVRRGADLDAAALRQALDALPVMAERRVVVIRDVTGLRKDVRAVLERYLERPAADTVLLLVAAAGAKPDATLLDRAAAVDFRPLTEDELAKWVARRATSLGATITPGATALLCGATGNDLALIAGELDKLRSYANGGAIDESAGRAVGGGGGGGGSRGGEAGCSSGSGRRGRRRGRGRAARAGSGAAEDDRRVGRHGADDADARDRVGARGAVARGPAAAPRTGTDRPVAREPGLAGRAAVGRGGGGVGAGGRPLG